MPKVTEADLMTTQGVTAWINGPAGSGKTRLALGFPDVFAVTFDPTGLDLLKEPENASLRSNLRWHCPMNGLPLNQLFAFSEKAGEEGIYPAIALAKELAKKGEIQTFLLDGFTYLAQLKWTAILEAMGVDPNQKETVKKNQYDARGAYDALGSYLDHLILQNVLPLATRYKLNVIITCHVQRESVNTVEGMDDTQQSAAQRELARQSKRLVRTDSDLSPQVLGSFRQRIEGLPSAMIYLDHNLDVYPEKNGKGEPHPQAGQEYVKYTAYCKLARSKSYDTVIKAKNRYGLGTLNLTGASFYKTLVRKIEEQANAKAG